jgi:simple sugar transport system permease protein
LSEAVRSISTRFAKARFDKPAIFALAALITGIAGAIVVALAGFSVSRVYAELLFGAVGSASALAGSLVFTTPILFTSLAATVAFQAGVWNVGGDGQLMMGAFGATLVALNAPGACGFLLLPFVLLGGVSAGALWALISAALKIWSGVNEILTTLMLNYVAFLWIDYLLVGPLKDSKMGGWPLSPPFPSGARLPSVPGTGVHLGLLLALATAVMLFVLFRHSQWGYEVRVQGQSLGASRYAGIPIARNITLAFALSGGLAALAGVGEVAGVGYRLFQLNREGYGFIGVLVSWLAGHSPLGAVIVSFLFGALLQGGAALKLAGVPPAIVRMLQAVLILAVMVGLEASRRWQLTPADEALPSPLPSGQTGAPQADLTEE